MFRFLTEERGFKKERGPRLKPFLERGLVLVRRAPAGAEGRERISNSAKRMIFKIDTG